MPLAYGRTNQLVEQQTAAVRFLLRSAFSLSNRIFSHHHNFGISIVMLIVNEQAGCFRDKYPRLSQPLRPQGQDYPLLAFKKDSAHPSTRYILKIKNLLLEGGSQEKQNTCYVPTNTYIFAKQTKCCIKKQ
ncbi:hypothetical protein HYW54_02635 [Candidatus Gottesmanbacteria bacterium]|nr:hypothetical protein [Candidatus Gottesmanbacteria bacterium]